MEKSTTIKFCEQDQVEPTHFTVEEFEKRSGMTYLSKLAFINERSYETIKRKIKKAIDDRRISPRARRLGLIYDEQIASGFVNDVIIKWVSNEIGYGLFANALLEGGDMIGEYTGLVKPITIFSRSINEYCFRYPLYGLYFIYYTIDAKMQGNELSFMNHSDRSNCDALVMLQGGLLHMILVANRTIEPGEQLWYDYGKNYKNRFIE